MKDTLKTIATLSVSLLLCSPAFAGVYKSEGGDLFRKSRELNICWWGGDSQATLSLRKKIETHISSEMRRLNRFSLNKNWPSCESISENKVSEWINLLIYDDPHFDIPSHRKRVLSDDFFRILGFDDHKFPGHPRRLSSGDYHVFRKFDLVLTSRFQSVRPSLVEQARQFSTKGRENLLLSIALHEFMHLLGVEHEHTHPDSDCYVRGDEPLSRNDMFSQIVGDFNPSSIMSYCVTRRFNYNSAPLYLSSGDIQDLRVIYPK